MAGIARSSIGDAAPWFVLAAWALSILVRTIDIESWSLFIPHGLSGRAENAYGPRVGNLALAAVLTERLLLAALAAVLCGQYAVSFAAVWISQWSVTARLTIQELVAVGAIVLIGLLWARARLGLDFPSGAVANAVWTGVMLIVAVIVLGAVTLLRNSTPILGPSLCLSQRFQARPIPLSPCDCSACSRASLWFCQCLEMEARWRGWLMSLRHPGYRR